MHAHTHTRTRACADSHTRRTHVVIYVRLHITWSRTRIPACSTRTARLSNTCPCCCINLSHVVH